MLLFLGVKIIAFLKGDLSEIRTKIGTEKTTSVEDLLQKYYERGK